jgi:UDP-N-acetylmuramoyl-tripeptide--D-alanyl-D-alanine ligase
MDSLSLHFIADASGGTILSGAPESLVRRLCTDSRRVEPGDLFVALPGERFDGHSFVPEVAAKGAAAVVVARGHAPAGLGSCAVIAVDDTRQALGRLSARYRRRFSIPVLAVGGSNGKTTTKELLASVLGQKLNVLASEASFNNDIGVPLSLLRLEQAHQAAVLEAGTNHPGELAPLIEIIGPEYGVITSIGREHLEFFGDVAGVAREEGCLAEMLPASGTLFINGDSEWTADIVKRARASVVRVGFAPGNDWRVRSQRQDRLGLTFRVEGPDDGFAGEYRVNLLGRHQAINALLAIVVGRQLGLGRAEIERGLAACKPAKMRLQLWEHNGVKVLDDAYNANADSVAAALQTLLDLPCKGRRLAVLGDMAELGSHSEAAHEEIGRRAAELGVGQLFAVGKMAPVMGRGARRAGLNRVFEFGDVESAVSAVRNFVRQGDLLLLKASRATHLERISEGLRSPNGGRKI